MAGPDGRLERPGRTRDRLARARRVLRRYPSRTAALFLAVGTGLLVVAIASWLFPHHSANHDEGVYLLQAAMLLEGRLELHAGDLASSFRPWFFVQDGGRLYPKYAPVPAAIFAVGKALGEARISLGLVAAGNVALCYAVVSAAWDRRTGVVAALALVGSPLFLASSSVFLPYAPTALLTWTFAFAYVRAMRRRRLRDATLAGGAIGIAFFARPYTAVLFAAPFVGHALWSLANGFRSLEAGSRAPRRVFRSVVRAFRLRESATTRARSLEEGNAGSAPEELASRTAVLSVVAALGLAGVALTLLYNRALTGSALLFPYEAFAPMDGPGFGRREILDHSVAYTPELAVRTNAHLLWYLATRWIALGPLGAALAGLGAAVHARGGGPADPARLGGQTLRWLLVGVVPAVVVGNVAFWGNYNLLATIADPTDGLFALFGPFYHFDLLLPFAGFAAAGALAIAERVARVVRSYASAGRPNRRRVGRIALAALVLLALPVGAAVQASILAPPLERNVANTAAYERAYEPFAGEDRDLEGALVFVPTPYGDWLQHPFQSLRNDPGLDGERVYALDRDPASNFAVIDAYPERRLYRYTYRGEWTPDPDDAVRPKLEPLETRSGERLTARIDLGVPPGVENARVTLANGDERRTYDVADGGSRERIGLEWVLTPDGTSVGGANATAAVESDGQNAASPSVPLPEKGTVSLLVTLTQFDGSTMTYRFDLAVRTTGDELEVVWPPETKVCRLTTDCGREGTYLPDHPEEHPTGVAVESELAVASDDGTSSTPPEDKG